MLCDAMTIMAAYPATIEVRGRRQLTAHEAAALQLVADSKFLQRESLVELVKAVVQAAGPLQRLSATPESMENAEVTRHAPAVIHRAWISIWTYARCWVWWTSQSSMATVLSTPAV